MGFLKRFGWYLMGLSIGLIFLAFFWKKKSQETGVEFCYLPNCRVLKALRESPLEVNEELRQYADTAAVTFLLREGDVEFDLSDPRGEPCPSYFVVGNYQGEIINLLLERCDSTTRLIRYDVVVD
ncbi:hypothetical protein SAMN04490243_1813 [Robiginitalea myxolifaciens]|uniref:DUF4258 domain-containing protein n=1 Tax=Robiginitalea myxolifaciens TaxID=400055 RepID=A0A1I6GW81_9FLAO|nr:hypothetical protein [Robiginitalea myxolifaciens]SFR46475.1 hypothetical protein SAMN04490243_1813 [Robiginitalea myxolifaciens]